MSIPRNRLRQSFSGSDSSLSAAADSALQRILWTAFAVTVPLFGVDMWRFIYEPLRIHIALPMLVLVLVGVVGCFETITRSGSVPPESRLRGGTRLIAIFTGLFVLWHVVAMARAFDVALAGREVIKIAAGLGCLLAVLAFFPRNPKFVERFWAIAVWSTSVLMVLMIYSYVFVYHAPYLGSDLSQDSPVGKNQMAGFLVYILPLALTYACTARWRLHRLIPLFVLVAALVYGGSRGAWVASVIALVAICLLARSVVVKRVLLLVVLAAILVSGSGLVLKNVIEVDVLDAELRMAYLFHPDQVLKFDSYNLRMSLVQRALALAGQSPIIGLGLTNTRATLGRLPHNDYVLIFCDLGVIGLALFTVVLVVLISSFFRRTELQPGDRRMWTALGVRGALVAELVFMLTMDRIYTTTLFWTFIGLSIVAINAWPERALMARPPQAPSHRIRRPRRRDSSPS